METIEIRQNKRKLIPMLALLSAALIMMIYYVYFSGRFNDNNGMKILYFFGGASLLYAIYIPAKKFIRNEPVLTFSRSEIEINEKGKPVSYLWVQVLNWSIEKDPDGRTQYLVIETAGKKREINISWLEKKPAEIEALMLTYKPK
jgi:hypothetical protein